MSSKTVYTVILLFSRVPYHIQKNFWPFFNSPGDEDFKTHLTLLPRWKIDQVTAQNVRQTGFWKYHFDGRFCFFIEGVANFRVNYLSHLKINFQNSCAHFAANFLNFPKHPQHFEFWWYWKEICKFKQKSAFFKKCWF